MVSIVLGCIVLWLLDTSVLGPAARAGVVAADGSLVDGYAPAGRAKALAIGSVLIWWLSVIVSGRLVAYLAAI